MLSAAAHELRGPLGVARGYLRLLAQQGGGDARATRAVEQAGQATDRMAVLVEEISAYARLASGEIRMLPKPVPLADVLGPAAERAAVPADAPVRVRVEIPSDLTISVDGARLTDACAAMVAALARAQVGETVIVVTAEAAASRGRVTVRITVASGLDAPCEERALRVGRSGAGLSLAMAELTVRLHQGTTHECWAGANWIGYVVRL